MGQRIAVTIVAVGLLLAACGDSDDSADGGDDGVTVETLTPFAPDNSAPDPAGETRPTDGEDIFAVANLTVTVTHPERDTVSYRISCLGDTATIEAALLGVDPELACTALGNVGVVERLVEGPPADQMCTENYGGPDVATITGTLGGTSVEATVNRTNGCGISDWEQLLADILPAAVGVTS